ncbi:MAG: glycosyltransferase family 1 protein, partial [Paracoccaceae bacterium]
MPDLTDIDVIAPNFKRRMSGVTSTVIRLVPLQARHINIVSSGPKLPPDLPQVPMMQLLQLPKDRPIVWHARRNSEMLPGLILKHVFRKNLKLVFTSAAQRDHSTYTKWLIGQMDHVIATSARAAAYLQVPNTIIHHGIDTQTFHPVADKEALRAQLKLPQNGPVIGCFGRIRPQKGCDIFVNAMIRVLRDMPEAHAVLMGGVGDKFQDFANDLQHDIKIANLSDRFRILP